MQRGRPRGGRAGGVWRPRPADHARHRPERHPPAAARLLGPRGAAVAYPKIATMTGAASTAAGMADGGRGPPMPAAMVGGPRPSTADGPSGSCTVGGAPTRPSHRGPPAAAAGGGAAARGGGRRDGPPAARPGGVAGAGGAAAGRRHPLARTPAGGETTRAATCGLGPPRGARRGGVGGLGLGRGAGVAASRPTRVADARGGCGRVAVMWSRGGLSPEATRYVIIISIQVTFKDTQE